MDAHSTTIKFSEKRQMRLLSIILIVSFFYLLLAYALRWFERSNHPELSRGCTIYQTGLKPVLYFFIEYIYLLIHLIMLFSSYLFMFAKKIGLYKKNPPHSSNKEPVIILIHGYMMRSGVMWFLKQRLKLSGYKQVYLFDYYPPKESIEFFARMLSRFVDDISNETQIKVSIIAHSMGGLISRYYINELGGYKHVERLITLGTPYAGSQLWSFAVCHCGRQMRPGSLLLKQMSNKYDDKLKNIAVTSIYSDFDELVIPQESAVLSIANAENKIVCGVGHVGLLFDNQVYRLIKLALLKQSNVS